MKREQFRERAHEIVDWIADYLDRVEAYPVRSPVEPGDILAALPEKPPEEGESFDALFRDFEKIVLPGITHWQHPSFFAYFPANSSRISGLAEMLTAALGTQCMIWQTSPAAAELEERVMQWLAGMMGLPDCFTGVIQDTASTATLTSILTAREAHSEFAVNASGLKGKTAFTTYCSVETHSSNEKAVKSAGLGKAFLRKIPVDGNFAMIPEKLEEAVKKDRENGLHPLCTVATIGTTSSTAVDPLRKIGEICAKYKVWLHVDAAFSGTAMLCPEQRWMIDGIEYADTYVFNPHKWMFTNFDCSAYFVKDPSLLVRTFEILPEYLKTRADSRVKNYRDWGIPLGRRFRALKLWFVIRNYGVKGLQEKIRRHIRLARELSKRMEAAERFEILAPVPLNLICFRYRPPGVKDKTALDRINAELLDRLNATGKLFMTHTRLNGVYTLRMMIGQTEVEERHVEQAWDLIRRTAESL